MQRTQQEDRSRINVYRYKRLEKLNFTENPCPEIKGFYTLVLRKKSEHPFFIKTVILFSILDNILGWLCLNSTYSQAGRQSGKVTVT